MVFSLPHQLARLFKMEEELIVTLRMATGFYKSETLDLYLETCEPRFKQLSLPDFSDLNSESEYLAKILVDLVGNPIHVYSLLDRLVVQLPRGITPSSMQLARGMSPSPMQQARA